MLCTEAQELKGANVCSLQGGRGCDDAEAKETGAEKANSRGRGFSTVREADICSDPVYCLVSNGRILATDQHPGRPRKPDHSHDLIYSTEMPPAFRCLGSWLLPSSKPSPSPFACLQNAWFLFLPNPHALLRLKGEHFYHDGRQTTVPCCPLLICCAFFLL